MKNSVKLFATVVATVAMTACAEQKPAVELTASGLNPEQFVDSIDGKATALYTLKNANGMEV